jgi:hypothetical protein
LSGDHRSREARLWAPWLRQLPRLRKQVANAFDFDPLRYNETASVGLLATAAGRAGFLTLAEFVSDKRAPGRGRPYRNGRCDLWLGHADTGAAWAIEFKQLFCAARCRPMTLEDQLRRACEDAWQVDAVEGRRFGALIVSGWLEDALPIATVKSIETLAAATAYSCRVGGGTAPVWLLFDEPRKPVS